MNLNEVKVNADCIIGDINLDDFWLKVRVMELGLTAGTRVRVLKRSIGKKTLLIRFNNSCFTFQDRLAKGVVVYYA